MGLSTNLALNDAAPLEDGDQSPIKRVLPGTPAQELINVWCAGTSFGLLMNPDLPAAARAEVAPPFIHACCTGDLRAVAAALAAAAAAAPARELLARHHTAIRMSALHYCVAGARSLGVLPPAAAARADHVGVARALLDAGAPLEARDVLGMTPLHHATTAVFSRHSLAIAALLVERGASVSPRNRAGRTPLIEITVAAVASPDKLPAVRFLLEVGTDPQLPDTDGISPVSLASSSRLLSRDGGVMELISAAALRGRAGAGRTLAGERLALQGLQAAPELNGQVVAVGAFDPYSGRYTCTLASGEVKAIKPSNLASQPRGACGQCGGGAQAGGQLESCGGCLAVKYCGVACQRAHWKAGHREQCRAAQAAAAAAAAAAAGGGSARAVPLRQPADLARREQITLGGRETPQWALRALARGQLVALKVQRPVMPGGAAAGLDLLLYNESRAFVALVKRGEQPAYDALVAAIDSASNACRGLSKAYVVAKVVEGGLELNCATILEPQPW